MKKFTITLLVCFFCLQAACTPAPATVRPLTLSQLPPLPQLFPKIDRTPAPSDYQRGVLSVKPTYDPSADPTWQMDLRSYDVSGLDFSQSAADLEFASFDSRTVWPAAYRLPQDFDWRQIQELGKNPGLGLRGLHALNITGYGVGIAIIDQTLLVDHQEYAGQLRLYEESSDIQGGWLQPQMHGPAVASIAVGKTVGVAPGADLYYIASTMCVTRLSDPIDFACLAQNVDRVLAINQLLPPQRKIRVLSMSIGWGPDSQGYAEITAATQRAKAAGMLVICSSVDLVHGFKFHGLGRTALADPDAFASYTPGGWWANDFYAGKVTVGDRLLVPMDARTTASPLGSNEYAFYRTGGWSWSIPYIAGVYALAAQVKPAITPDEFWRVALQTGRTITLTHAGKEYAFGKILDPTALVIALQK